MSRPRIGIALCGSYCTYAALFPMLEELAKKYDLVPIMSDTAASTDTRFGTAADNMETLKNICGALPVSDIVSAEPLGPTKPTDALIIAPCTGNTMAKLANGISDSAVTMAAKAHLRNNRPLVIAFSTNDGLSGSLQNIAALLNRKNYYFVPFRQDAPTAKPNSLASDFSLIDKTLTEALLGKQLQPILASQEG